NTKSLFSRHSENSPAPNPVRSTRFNQSLGMIWSVSTSDRTSGTPRPVITRTASMCISPGRAGVGSVQKLSAIDAWLGEVFGGGEVAGDRGGRGDGGGDEVRAATLALA